MNKSTISNLKFSIAINSFIVIMLSMVAPSGIYPDNYGENTIQFNNKVLSKIKDSETVLSPKEQVFLVDRFNSYVRREALNRSLAEEVAWAFLAGIGFSLILQIIVLTRMQRNQNESKKPLPDIPGQTNEARIKPSKYPIYIVILIALIAIYSIGNSLYEWLFY